VPGVYISYPFCARKCTFCNFESGVYPNGTRQSYLEALSAELARHEWAWQPETLYLGGGSPGEMELDSLARILAAVPGAGGAPTPWLEATIEAPPEAVTLERARGWAALGINRVSLGVQSLVESEARATGRVHSPRSVEAAASTLRACDLGNINVDLIAGLPGQTRASWELSLEALQRLAVPHASVYMFEIDMDSRLGREVLSGGTRYGAPQVPGEDETAELYEIAVERLAAAGLARYEISNFARPGFESRHNLKYWKLAPYMGFGAGAHSFDGATRRANPDSVEAYLAAAVPTSEPAHTDEERFFVGLRLMEGIEPAASEWHRFAAPIARFVQDGLLSVEGPRLRLTARGVLLSNEVFQEFVA
jgi:oxygen-independent coproporphyrinogen III oxidase